MTQGFKPAVRQSRPSAVGADITVATPPELATPTSPGLLARVLPVVISVAALGVTAIFFSRSGMSRNPTLLAFPMMMVASTLLTLITGRGQRRGRGIRADRIAYLELLSRLRDEVAQAAAAQRSSLIWSHPEPETLWTLIGGPRMWERRANDPDFCRVRVASGTQPLARRLVAPQDLDMERCDPVTVAAMQRFIRTHSTIDEAPTAIGLHGAESLVIDGGADEVRGLLRAMICQLAVFHPPDQLLIACVISERNQAEWDWLKWLPHNQHPLATDSVGSARMVYRSDGELRSALAAIGLPYLVVIADLDERTEFDCRTVIPQTTLIETGPGCDGSPLVLRYSGEAQAVEHPDHLNLMDALVCARRLAAYRVDTAARCRGSNLGWPNLVGIDDVVTLDPNTLWRNEGIPNRLRIPIGTTPDGAPVELDIKEPAEGGIGPHGLCVGATGSGKSELLRTVALGMMARNSPDALNLLLVDFKGGATFLDLARAPHVAAIITNLSEEAPLVARMRDALAGELNRRQQLLRAAGCGSVAAYEKVRRTGKQLSALPTLFIVVDEFSELLSQHPDFADMFVAIGRLGRSLGMHLLLASQRLEEGRLRGLEAHLSYRMCLKTLSASESRTVLGTPDAYQLPSTPGAGFLRSGSDELIRFQAAFVSGTLRESVPDRTNGPTRSHVSSDRVQPFTLVDVGPVRCAPVAARAADQTVLQTVVRRLSGLGSPAHQIWLPPLGPAPWLDSLLSDAGPAPAGLTVPIGIVDRPFEQCRTPLVIDLSGAAGNLAVVGAPQAGKSTALRTVITALAATHDPSQVQFYCLDFGGGTLGSVRTLPHVGAVASRAEPRLAIRIIAELESIVRTREAIYCERGVDSIAQYRQHARCGWMNPDEDPFGDVFLVSTAGGA